MQLATCYIQSQPFEGIVGLEEGFMRGSCFTNLYKPFKFEAKDPKRGTTQKQNILYLICVYGFAITDLSEFLDTHPTDKKALEALNKVQEEYQKAKTFYEQRFGPLCIYSGKDTTYQYLEGPWPWEERL